MHLSGVRIRGFKSFADAVELRFEPGVSVIVGPNGSGKSNVTEAMQWAMASQPPSELRVQTGLDVLFAGSERRPASGLCEVELVLDNADGGFGTGRPEISVMRRLGRDGTSQYLLNRVAVRRLDVQEALADAGLGRELHAIIGQGKVEEILLSKPADRRGLIEEAAGLGKYKRRRQRAQQKLARVESALVRARDVEGELRGRLRPLALQATAAERAAALEEEIAKLRLELLGSEIAAARRNRGRLSADLATALDEGAAIDQALAGVRGERETAETALGSLAAERERHAERAYALAAARDRLLARAEALRERAEAIAEERERAGVRASRMDEEAATARALADEAQDEAERHAVALAGLADDEAERALADLVRETATALEAALGARSAVAELDGRVARATGEARELASRAEALGRRAVELETGVLAGSRARGEREEALRAAEDAAARADAAASAATEALGAARGAAERAREAERVRGAERAAAAEAERAARTRLDAAVRAVERGDGLGPALRRLRARGVALAVDLVEPDQGIERALAAALVYRAGEAITADAAAAVALLAEDDLDGAALLCLDRVPARPAPTRGVPLASRVRLAEGAPAGLLDGVALVDDADDLLRLGQGIGVLADGRGFDADRGVAFRAGDQQAAALEARRERGEAATAAESAAAALAVAEEALATARGARGAAEAQERAAREHEAAARGARDAAERAAAEARRHADRAAREEEGAQERLAAARRDEEGVRARLEAAGAEASALGAERGEAQGRLDRLVAAHAAVEERRAGLAERVGALRAERATVEARLERSRGDAARASQRAHVAHGRAASARRRATALEGLLEALPRALEPLAAAAARCDALRAPELAAQRALEERASELARVLAATAERIAADERRARDVAARATGLQVEVAHLAERHDELARRRRDVAERAELAIVDRTDPLPEAEERDLAARIERAERRLEALGAVNPLARQEYEEARLRVEELAEQIDDLERSLKELRRLIRDLTQTIQERFAETFEKVERGFREVVETLFPGGRGRLRLVEPAPIAVAAGEDGEEAEADDGEDEATAGYRPEEEPGVELEISPAGKRIVSLSMLSGGEKALSAIGFLFALMLARPCPFYVLDEVEAALDESNIERFLTLIDRFRDRAQFIVITHQKRTMEAADVLYGVTMANDGVSRVVSRRLPRDAAARAQVLNPA